MRGKCYVESCSSGYASSSNKRNEKALERRTLFSVPRCEIVRTEWDKALDRKDKRLSVKDVVCDLHFNDHDVERYYETLMPDGSIHRIERVRYRLKPGAIPIAATVAPEPNMLQILQNSESETKNMLEDISNEQGDVFQRRIQEVEDYGVFKEEFYEQVDVKDLIHQQIELINDRAVDQANQDGPQSLIANQGQDDDNNVKVKVEGESNVTSSYHMESLMFDLDRFRLPMGWAYVVIDKGVLLIHIAKNLQIDINFSVNRNMKMQISTGDHKVSLDYSDDDLLPITSFDDLLSNLGKSEVLGSSACQGTGMINMRADRCSGFSNKTKPPSKTSFARCEPCRLLRKRKQDQERRKYKSSIKKRRKQTEREKADSLNSMKRKTA